MTETTTTDLETLLFESLLKQREKARKMERKWEQKVSELTRLINEKCIHSQTETVTEYEAGSYFDRAHYHTIKKCLICKKELGRKTEIGSYG